MTTLTLFPSAEDIELRRAAQEAQRTAAREWDEALRACSTPEELAAIVFDKIKELHNTGDRVRVGIEWDEQRMEPWMRQHVPDYDANLLRQIYTGPNAVAGAIQKSLWERLNHDVVEEVWIHPDPHGFPSLAIDIMMR